MANERMYPILPCRDIDESIAFYEALGFKRTYLQQRPNPYAVVEMEDMQVHLGAIEGFNPQDSYASVLIAVPDPDALYRAFAEGLRGAYGRLPVRGIPRILRPRKKYGTVRGFSIVDPGGNWLRIYRLDDSEEAAAAEAEAEQVDGLAQIVNVAARLGDSHGDEDSALRTLEKGIARHPDAPAGERALAFLYQAELAVRTGNLALAQTSLAEAEALVLADEEKAALATEFSHIREIIRQETTQSI
jgi:catechol 2,3-dioxygenase-like lactoylglutathione lyase family enzyme